MSKTENSAVGIRGSIQFKTIICPCSQASVAHHRARLSFITSAESEVYIPYFQVNRMQSCTHF